MQVSTESFFGLIQSQMAACISEEKKRGPMSHCLDPSKYQTIGNLFSSFLTKHSQFGNCKTLNNASQFKCTASDGTEDFLLLETNPLSFGMIILNDRKNVVDESGYGTRWFGSRINCAPSFISDTIAYQCQGGLPDMDRYSYYLSETNEGICHETYSPNPSKGGYVDSDCKNGLFDKFLSHSTFVEISSLSSVWSYSKLAIGMVGTAYFGYKTVIELTKLWKTFEPKVEENKIELQPEATDQKSAISDVLSTKKDSLKPHFPRKL